MVMSAPSFLKVSGLCGAVFICMALMSSVVQAQPGDAEALERAKALVATPVEPGEPKVPSAAAVSEAGLPPAVSDSSSGLTEAPVLLIEEGVAQPQPPEKRSSAAASDVSDIAQGALQKSPDASSDVAPVTAEVPDDAALADVSVLPRPDSSPGTDVPALPETPKSEFDENLFFDAEALVPAGEIAKKAAPSKVDPSLNPGSVLVVSTKTAGSESKEAQLVAADRARKLGLYESALQIYDTLYATNKRDPNILMGRAATLQNLGRVDEAIKAYEELLKVRPKNVEAQINLQGLIGKHYPAVALRALQDLYDQNPGNIAVVAQLAVIEAQLGHYQEAVRYLGMAASMEPQNASHVYNMAVIADKSGDKKSAVKYYEDSLEIDTLYGAGRSIPRESVFERLAQIR